MGCCVTKYVKEEGFLYIEYISSCHRPKYKWWRWGIYLRENWWGVIGGSKGKILKWWENIREKWRENSWINTLKLDPTRKKWSEVDIFRLCKG